MRRSRRWYLLLGLLMLGTLILIALFAEQITPVSPDYRDARSHILEGVPPFPPEAGHPLGTDAFGRDIWSRVAYGTRWSLLFAAIITAARLLLGIPAALGAVFGPRIVGWLVGRCYVFSSAIPPLLIYLLMLSNPTTRLLGLWPSAILTASLLTLMEWPRLAVALKGRMEHLLTQPFVEGAVAAGASPGRIFRIHLLPHLWPLLLQLVSQEIGRALLVLAQLGIFGVMMGGGVLEAILVGPQERNIIISGIAEWGGMLGDSRQYVLIAPWIAFAPALAFLFGVTGANLLSQGLESITFSAGKLQEATTGRLAREWRWALAPLLAAAVLSFYQGLPWGREQEVFALIRLQAEALSQGRMEPYLATIDQGEADFWHERVRWAEELTEGERLLLPKEPTWLQVRGSRATAWFPVKPPPSAEPSSPSVGAGPQGTAATLWRYGYYERRSGHWYQVPEPVTALRGFHVDLVAGYDPNNPAFAGISVRDRIAYLATVSDHAFEQVRAMYPEAEARPRVKVFSTAEEFRRTVAARSGQDPGTAQMWWAPEGRLLVSPDFLKSFNRSRAERSIANELVKAVLPADAAGRMPPLVVGELTLLGDDRPAFRVDFREMAGATLFTLEQLFGAQVADLSAARQQTYATQSAILIQLLGRSVAEERLSALARSGAGLEVVAGQAGVSVADLSALYAEEVYRRIVEESILAGPAASMVPGALKEAIAARAGLAPAGATEAFLSWVAPANRDQAGGWLSGVRRAGLTKQESLVLDLDERDGKATVYLLERLSFAQRPAVTAVVRQEWVWQGDRWLLTTPWASPWGG